MPYRTNGINGDGSLNVPSRLHNIVDAAGKGRQCNCWAPHFARYALFPDWLSWGRPDGSCNLALLGISKTKRKRKRRQVFSNK